jgi:nucleotide-binding universal stress UspA family protein
MEKILIPTDFSKCADAAIDFVVQTAKISSVYLTVTHVFEFYPLLYGDPAAMATAYPLAYREDVEKELQAVKSKIMDNMNVHVETKVYDAPVMEGILLAVKEARADLVVMGTHGRTDLGEKLFGGQTAMLIARGGVPVLAIPCNHKWHKPKRIVLATNTFEKQPAVLEFLLDFIRFYGAELHIVVFTDEEKDKALTLVEHEHQLKTYTEMIKLRYGITAIAKHIYGHDLEEALNTYIKENEIDILSMVTHKRKLFGRIFNPSITKRMSHHVKIPLLALPSKNKID